MSGRSAIVVPCYNESLRLDPEMLRQLAAVGNCDVVAVDDGSTDTTAALLGAVAAADQRVHVLTLARNQGKGEAVRQGLLWAADQGYNIVGFCDADFATPVGDVSRLIGLCAAGCDVVLGSRVALLGHDVQRSPMRHYAGRVFATATSLVLGFQVYDTQCGAKVFRCGPELRSALTDRFVSRWAFDVELLGRLEQEYSGTDSFLEEPLQHWHDVAGSKVSASSSLRAAADLWRIRKALARRRATFSGRDGAPIDVR